jgi:hypothetical protein
MKTPLVLLSCLALLICPNILAQTNKGESPKKERQIEDILDVIPKNDLLQLRGSKQADAAMEFTQKMRDAELNKEGTFRITVDSVRPHLFEDNVKGWLMHGRFKPIKAGAVTIAVVTHICFRQDPEKLLDKIRPGRDLLITGLVSKSEIVLSNGAPALWVDVQVASFGMAK